jgi:hypothetical protein
MCCAAASLVFLGPRFFIILWWIYDPTRWDRAFSTVLWPILGFLFMPWTTLMYVSVQRGGVFGWDWFFIVIGVLADLASYSGSAYGNRDRIPGGYATTR